MRFLRMTAYAAVLVAAALGGCRTKGEASGPVPPLPKPTNRVATTVLHGPWMLRLPAGWKAVRKGMLMWSAVEAPGCRGSLQGEVELGDDLTDAEVARELKCEQNELRRVVLPTDRTIYYCERASKNDPGVLLIKAIIPTDGPAAVVIGRFPQGGEPERMRAAELWTTFYWLAWQGGEPPEGKRESI